MNRREYIKGIISQIIDDEIKADIILERLEEEGVLHLGYGNAEIDMVVKKFSDTFGTTKTSKYDRFAAKRLVDKYGTDAVTGIIGLLGQRSTERFAPVVNNISQLETKWVTVLNFVRKTVNEEVIDA